MSINIDLYIDQGCDFTAIMPAVTDANGVVDLTTYTVASQMRQSYASTNAVNVNVAITDPTNGVITLTLPATETAGLSPVRYVYDVLVTRSNVPSRVFDGLIVVNPGVTGKPITNVLTPYIPDDFGGGF